MDNKRLKAIENLKLEIFEPENQGEGKFDHLLDPLIGKNPRIVLVGASHSGKTQFFLNYLFNWNRDYYLKSGGTIVIQSTTSDTCQQINDLGNEKGFSYKKMKIMPWFSLEHLQEEYERFEGEGNLIILDDCSFKKGFNSKYKPNVISEIFTSGRHKNTGIIIASQKYNYLGEDCRSMNCTHLVVYSTLTLKEQLRIYEENLSLMMSLEEFKKIMSKHLRKKFSFIVIDKANKLLFDNEFRQIIFKREDEDKILD